MENLVLLTETIVKKIGNDEGSVSVREFESTEDDTIQIEVMVSNDDLGKVIGRNGKTINAIRTIVQASATINGGKRTKINVDSY